MHRLLKILFGFLIAFSINQSDLSANNDNPNLPKKAVAENNAPPSGCIGNSGVIPRYLYYGVKWNYLDRLKRQPNFPQSPDHIEYMRSLKSEYNWHDTFGSFTRGFILAPETGQYVFNLTGDDYCEFYLSTDEMPENIGSDTTAHIPGWSGITEHTKYPTQTSDTITLTAGNYYYFEVYQQEGWGGDHVQVYWKMPSTIGLDDWEIVHGSHLYEYICDPVCPTKGSWCNDGDPLTDNDAEDGFCNCYGVPQTLPFQCIGDRGTVTALFWDNVEGDEIADLEADANYPLSPDRAVIFDRLEEPNDENLSNYGTRIRGYIYIPVTGDYEFNVTGNNETAFYLGTGETVDPNTDLICHVPDYTDHFEHWKYPSQTSSIQSLTGGTFYSIEMLQKENWGSDHFYVFWKPAYKRDTNWHIIDGGVLFQYDCELACIPEGTPCNDNNANTFDDKYGANCQCVGTPCSDPECSNSWGYTAYDDCAASDKHSDSPNDSWLSCAATMSPNVARGVSHWIHYDFGALFSLDEAQIWNYNADGNTGQGFNNVVIDYSVDGMTWTELGTFNWNQASGESTYNGFQMSEFSGIVAQHILITALDNFDGSNCMGISEISFSAFDCPSAGTACDDGDLETINDVYNALCVCAGTSIINECVALDSTINDDPIPSSSFEIEATITSAGKIYSGGSVQFIAGTKVSLMPGFKVSNGGEFLARILPCSAPSNEEEPKITIENLDEKPNKRDLSLAFLNINPNPTRTWTNINFNIPESGNIQLAVYSSSGQLITSLVNSYQESGEYDKEFPAHQLAGGVYYVTLRTDEDVLTKRLIIVD